MALGRTIHETLRDNCCQKIESHQDLALSDVTDMFSDRWDREVQKTLFRQGENPGKFKDQGIRAGIFYPNDNYMCGICGYAEMCEKW